MKTTINMKNKMMICLAAAVLAAGNVWGGGFNAAVWRGETAYVDIPANAAQAMSAENAKTKDGVTVNLGRYDEVKFQRWHRDVKKFTDHSRPDVYREIKTGANEKATVCKITVVPDAKPGVRKFGPLEVTVVDRVLPPAKEWKYFLDLWQHPWAVSRYFGVKPFSKEHYAKMEPLWKLLADCGVKTLTVTLLDKPWNNQCYDAYGSMIGRVKKADGKWKFDYSLFDEYVEFGRKCGLGPHIACYTMCPWGYRVSWKDENGKEYREKMLPGTPEFEDYWGDFLVDFAAHLKAKGWFDDTYIAMDERGPKDVKIIAEFIQKKAPGMKIAMAGNKKPSVFEGITIDNYCQGLIHLDKSFLPELKPRREKGYTTTFYVCCSAAHPNTFMHSPANEGFWLGAYPVMIGFDGFLRWAANSWPKDPYSDATFKPKSWDAGDTYFVYPNGELSSRMIDLRAGVIAAEKLNILSAEKDISGDIKRLAAPYGYRGAVMNKFDFGKFRREVETYVNSTDSGAKTLKVMTYNIRNSRGDRKSPVNNWDVRKDSLGALVARENPDVAGFQEVLPDQRKWLEARFLDYAFIGEGRNADRVGGESSPVMYRKSRFNEVKSGTFWLSQTPEKPGSKGWDAALPRICTYVILKDKVTGKVFAFANTHTDHMGREAREKGMLLIIERMKEFGKGCPVVFVGDHNCLEHEPPAVAVSKELKDSLYLSETPPQGSWRTFSFWKWQDKELSIADALKKKVGSRSVPGGNSTSKRIDYIYVSPGTRVHSYKTIADPRPGTRHYPSDHFPSVAEISF